MPPDLQRALILVILLVGCDFGGQAEPDWQGPPLLVPVCSSRATGCSTQEGVLRLQGFSPSLAPEDLLPVASVLADAQVVGLGESAHMSRGFIGLKIRLSRLLIERHQFRVVTWESPRVATRRLDAFVQTCSGDASGATKGLGALWADTETRDFALWLCAWNQAHPSDRVQVHGFDVQGLASDRAELRALLGELLPTAANELLGSLDACERGEYSPCKSALASTSAALLNARSGVADEATLTRFADARIALTSYEGGQDAYYIADSVHAFEARDQAMANVFQQLRDRYFPKKKALIWAHNIHIVKQHQSALHSWVGGAIVTQGTQLEHELSVGSYRAVAILGFSVAINRPEQRGSVTSPRANSLEVLLHTLEPSALFLDLQRGRARAVLPEDQLVELGAPGVEVLVPERCFDGILFLDQSPMAEPL
jgi:erythromycin esterase-like protein